MTSLRSRDGAASEEIVLLGRFAALSGGEEIDVPLVCQRLLAMVALQPGPISRDRVLCAFWPDEPHERAASRLRTALSRLRRTVPWLKAAGHGSLVVADEVDIDYRRAAMIGRELTEIPWSEGPVHVDIHPFDRDLLPDWYDEWVVPERQAFRQLRFASLEAIAMNSLDGGHVLRAIQACLAVVRDEPLRESAHRLLVQAYAADGNLGEALSQVQAYERLLMSEAGLRPSKLMTDLRDSLLSST